MNYAKIVVKDDYQRRGDLVLRNYIRALRKIDAKELLSGRDAYIYGRVDNEGIFHELFTGKDIGFNRFEYASLDEILRIASLDKEKVNKIRKIIKAILFNENIEFDFEISNSCELAEDRKIEFQAYNEFLSRINPYKRLNDKDSSDYNDFLRKIDEIKTIEKYDSIERDFDAYDIDSYYEQEEKMAFSGFQKRIGK